MISRRERLRNLPAFWNTVKEIAKACSCLPHDYIDKEADMFARRWAHFCTSNPKSARYAYKLPEKFAAQICCTYFGKWSETDHLHDFWIHQMITEIKEVYKQSYHQLALYPERLWDAPPGYPDYTDGDWERFEQYRLEDLAKIEDL